MPLSQYRLYLDEVGTEDYGCVELAGGRHLSLVGVVMNLDDVGPATVRLDELKHSFFPRHPDESRVVIHRTDVARCRGPFQPLNDPDLRHRFDQAWLNFLSEARFRVICVVIDKRAMEKKQGWRLRRPYHYAMSVMAEKYARLLQRLDANGDVMPESRGGRKDAALQSAFDEVRRSGTYFARPELFARRMPASQLKFRRKSDDITGLQICESVAKPAQDYALVHRKEKDEVSSFTRRIHELLLREKFDKGPLGVWGYGLKYLP